MCEQAERASRLGRIAFYIDTLSVGGAETIAVNYLIVLRRRDDQPRTGFPCFPIGLTCFHARLFCQLRFCQHDSMPVLRAAAHSHGLAA